MLMCPRCQGFAERIEIRDPSDLYRRVDEIERILKEGTLASAGGNWLLSEIRPGLPWPGDVIEHAFRCVVCGQRFELVVDTYHGGGHWDAA
jgi:hypothetical protein